MKIRNLLFVLLALSFFACEEIPPTVTGSMGGGPINPLDTLLENQKRQVIIEEFTGVRCVQCPAGSALIEDLLAQNGEQLVAVSIHAGIFSPPYNDSQYDLQTDAGNDLLNFLGEPLGYPSSTVNRRLFDGELDLQLGDGLWAGFINEEIQIPPKVKIGVAPTYNETSRVVEMEVRMLVEETVAEATKLNIMFTESGIVDLQKIPGMSDPKPDYVHKHVLRGMATSNTGDIIPDALTAGAEITKEYSYTIPDGWVAENCHIIAFVSLSDGSKDVLQAVEVELVQ